MALSSLRPVEVQSQSRSIPNPHMSKCTMPLECRKLTAAATSTAILPPRPYQPNSRRELPADLSCRQEVRSRPAQYLGRVAKGEGGFNARGRAALPLQQAASCHCCCLCQAVSAYSGQASVSSLCSSALLRIQITLTP